MITPSKRIHEHNRSPGIVRVLSTALFLLSTSTFSYAQQPPPPSEGRGGPPPEAFTACEQSKIADVCTVVTPHGELTGVCRKDRRSEALLCVPENAPEERGRRRKSSSDSDETTRPHSDTQTN